MPIQMVVVAAKLRDNAVTKLMRVEGALQSLLMVNNSLLSLKSEATEAVKYSTV